MRFILTTLLLALLLVPIAGQRPFDDFRQRQRQRGEARQVDQSGASFGEYTFVRTIYDSPSRGYGRRGYGYGTWTTDYPEADNNFIVGLREWAGTNLKIAPRPEQIEILDDRIFDYPIIYFVEPGFLELSPEQAARLREYVARGGFMFFTISGECTNGKTWRHNSRRFGLKVVTSPRTCRFHIQSFIPISTLKKWCRFPTCITRCAARRQRKAASFRITWASKTRMDAS